MMKNANSMFICLLVLCRPETWFTHLPNELYRINDKGEILVDNEVKETALDYLREIKW